jgi:hypothetical protein
MMAATERLDRILNTLEPERAERLIDLRAQLRESGLSRDLDEQLDLVIDDLLDDLARLRARMAPPRLTRRVSLSSAPDAASNS